MTDVAGLEKALAEAQAADATTVIHIETDPLVAAPDSPAWRDVPVAEVSTLESTRAARTAYETSKARQRAHLGPPDSPAPPPSPEGSTDPPGHQ